MYEKLRLRAKHPVTQRASGEAMSNLSRIVISSIVGFMVVASAAEAQKRHPVRLEADPTRDSYRFTPASITARPGDVLVFKVGRGAPHSVVFEAADLNEATHEAMNGAMSRRTGDLSSPLLTTEGTEYRMVVPRIAPGVYHFYCLPHRAYDMRGELRVTK
jgi:plastocyanin